MKTAGFIFFISIMSSVCSFGQTPKARQFFISPHCSYTWQGTHNVDLGLQPMLLLDAKKDHSNIGLLVSGNLLFYNHATYFTPKTRLRIMPHKRRKTQHLAWSASVGHSYTNIHKKYDHRISPEIGIKWEWYNLSLGYNIPVSNYQDNCTKLLRVSFMLNLF